MKTLMISIFLAAAFALLAFFLAFILTSAATADKRATEQRLEELKDDDSDTGLIKSESDVTKRKRNQKKANRNNSFFDRFATTIYKELRAADVDMRPEEFMTIWIVVAVVPAALVAMFSSNVIISVILLVLGSAVPLMVIKKKQKKRVKEFENQLGDALVVCCNCLRSGLSFQQAMETIAVDVEAPLGTEFASALSEMNMGHSLEAALESMNERIPSEDLKLMVSAVTVQRQTGGNLSEILVTISEKIKGRMKMRQEIKAISAQGRMSGIIVGLLPFLILGMFTMINFDFVKVLYTETRGHIVLVVVAILECIAFAVIKKIINIKV